uniref:Uncharacterized protein n=1 Tax=Romanomermis culicivorax TaxID=13658 RepID=A0A915KXY6_ROMCU
GKPLLTSPTKSTKRTREEKSLTKSSKSPPKKPKVGAELNSTQASSSCRVIQENRSFVEIAFETPNVFKPKPPPPDCHFSAFNYFRRHFVTPVTNREAIDLRAQAEREAYRHLNDNLAAFIVCFMPPYHTEMPPAAREFAELRTMLFDPPPTVDTARNPSSSNFCRCKYFSSLFFVQHFSSNSSINRRRRRQ